jgi:hypothetical protein
MRLHVSYVLAAPWRVVAASLVVALAAPAAAAHAQAPGLPLKHAPQPTRPKISAKDLMTRLYIFADDSMEGRKYLTAGNVKGTNYLAAELTSSRSCEAATPS